MTRSPWPVAHRLVSGLVAVLLASCGPPASSAPAVASAPPGPEAPAEPLAEPSRQTCTDARATIEAAAAAHLEALDAKREEAGELYDRTGPGLYPEYDGELQVYRHRRAEVVALAARVTAGDPIPLVPRYRFAPWQTDETLHAFTGAITQARQVCGESDVVPEPPPPPPPPEEPPPDNWY